MNYRRHFPIFKKEFDSKKIIYFDNAATTQKPKIVIDRIKHFYEHEVANAGRGNHFLAEENSLKIEKTRQKVGIFLNTCPENIVFTSNCTDSINLVANSLSFKNSDEIIVSETEHHSNYLPWIQQAKTNLIQIDKDGRYDIEHLKKLISNRTKLISIAYVSNTSGIIQPIEEIINIARENNILTLIDASQCIAHFSIDVSELNCDFLTFSSHKMFGPDGVGILYVKDSAKKLLKPIKHGGGMVNKVTFSNITYQDFPHNMEAGTYNIEGILGFEKAIDFLLQKQLPKIHSYLTDLSKYFEKRLYASSLKPVFPLRYNSLPIFTFTSQLDIDLNYFSQILSTSNKIILRYGFHCAQLYFHKMGYRQGALRASLQIYNTKKEIDKFFEEVDKLFFLFR